MSNRAEVMRAAHDLDLPESQFRTVPQSEALPFVERIETRFVETRGLRWWWEAFRGGPVAVAQFEDGAGWTHLANIIPPESGLVWFIVEDDPEFILCQGEVNAVLSVIEDCFGFEYYIVSQSLDWLVCENHHGVVYAVGDIVGRQLSKLLANDSKEVAE